MGRRETFKRLNLGIWKHGTLGLPRKIEVGKLRILSDKFIFHSVEEITLTFARNSSEKANTFERSSNADSRSERE